MRSYIRGFHAVWLSDCIETFFISVDSSCIGLPKIFLAKLLVLKKYNSTRYFSCFERYRNKGLLPRNLCVTLAPLENTLCNCRSSIKCPRGGGGYSIYPWMGRCGTAPHTLTLFKTNIADFPTLFKTKFRFLIPCLRHLT